MTLTPETTEAALKAAIREGLDQWPDTAANAVDGIYAAVRAALGPFLAEVVQQGMQDPTLQAELAKAVLVPILVDIEDEIHNIHDATSTSDIDRPGLRRAARLIRANRRDVTEEIEKEPQR